MEMEEHALCFIEESVCKIKKIVDTAEIFYNLAIKNEDRTRCPVEPQNHMVCAWEEGSCGCVGWH